MNTLRNRSESRRRGLSFMSAGIAGALMLVGCSGQSETTSREWQFAVVCPDDEQPSVRNMTSGPPSNGSFEVTCNDRPPLSIDTLSVGDADDAEPSTQGNLEVVVEDLVDTRFLWRAPQAEVSNIEFEDNSARIRFEGMESFESVRVVPSATN